MNAPAPKLPPQRKVLVVDDDPIFRAIAVEALTVHGFEVDELEDGLGVARYVAAHRPVMVLIDILMPNKDGLEVIRELKRDHPGVKVLAVSSGGRLKSTDLLHWARLCGADATLQKPLGEETMLLAMAEAFGVLTPP